MPNTHTRSFKVFPTRLCENIRPHILYCTCYTVYLESTEYLLDSLYSGFSHYSAAASVFAWRPTRTLINSINTHTPCDSDSQNSDGMGWDGMGEAEFPCRFKREANLLAPHRPERWLKVEECAVLL